MIGISFLLVGIIMLAMSAFKAIKAKKFCANSALVTGTVASKERIKKDKSDSYRMTIRYTVDGVEYQKRLASTHGEYIDTSEGAPFELLYLISDPNQSIRPQDIKPQTVKLLLFLGVGFLVLGSIVFFIGL